ncbi:hypothetical protein E4P42_01965 [Mycobacterium sp. PS03-16]|uniref:hypothetical protein n=1 Tax=Mycobacterium sp. PS03-16 TaxID=2559611 RepID=UPI001073153C|nr:hypothetical protein [Mycobacterium sp. PS03-16]TFV60977.1 hypothetical protein E4P42_01965 [Mycobacterium sp. PS03-16]
MSSLPVITAADEIVAAPPAIRTTEVEMASFTRYAEILVAGAVAAIAESGHALQHDTPALFNQLAAQWADADLLPWNHSLVASSLLAPVAPLVVGPFTDAVAEVLADALPHGNEIREQLPATVDYAFARLVGPLLGALGGSGTAHQHIYRAGMAGDTAGQIRAILESPIHVIDGFLFGGYGDLGPLLTGELDGERIPAPGLLTPWGQWPADRNVTDEFPDVVAPTSTSELVDVTLAVEGTEDGTEGAAEPVVAPAVIAAETEEAVEEITPATDSEETVSESDSSESELLDPDAGVSTDEANSERPSVRTGLGAGRDEADEPSDTADDTPARGTDDTSSSDSADSTTGSGGSTTG